MTDLDYNLVLSRGWHRKHQPYIDWTTGTVTFNYEKCQHHLASKVQLEVPLLACLPRLIEEPAISAKPLP